VSTALLVSLVLAVAVAVHVVTGSGFGLIAAPLLLALDPELVPVPLLLVSLLVMAAVGGRDRAGLRHLDLWPAALAAVPAAVAALWVAPHLGRQTTAVVVGAAVVMAVVAALRGWRVPAGRWPLVVAGGFAGALSTLAATPGPPIVVAYRASDPVRLRANLCLFFLVTCAVSLGTLAVAGDLSVHALGETARLLPGVLLGLALGPAVRRRVPATAVRPVALWLCLAAGLALLSTAGT